MRSTTTEMFTRAARHEGRPFRTPPASDGRRRGCDSGCGGFTLAELLAVMLIISLLMTASFGSLFRARELAKRAKAEAELREMVNAWGQYYTTYWKWPASVGNGREVDVTANLLAPLTDPANGDNKYGIVFLNFSGTGAYTDPWGGTYRLTFRSPRSSGSGSNDRSMTIQEATVALPGRITVPVGDED